MIIEIFEGTKSRFWLYLRIDERRVPNVRMAFLRRRTLENRELHILVDKIVNPIRMST